MTEFEIRQRRARYRASHRGTKELDIVLGRFAEAHIPAMDEAELTLFEQVLALPDPDIDHWLRTGKAPDGVIWIINKIRIFHGMG